MSRCAPFAAQITALGNALRHRGIGDPRHHAGCLSRSPGLVRQPTAYSQAARNHKLLDFDKRERHADTSIFLRRRFLIRHRSATAGRLRYFRHHAGVPGPVIDRLRWARARRGPRGIRAGIEVEASKTLIAATEHSDIAAVQKHGPRWRVVIVAADDTRTHARESESGPGGFAFTRGPSARARHGPAARRGSPASPVPRSGCSRARREGRWACPNL